MNELFKRKLEAGRTEDPPSEKAVLHYTEVEQAFPELSPENAAQLAIEVLYSDWVPTQNPLYGISGRRLGRGRFLGVWFTDRAGYQKLYGD